MEFLGTEHPGHAVELARNAVQQGATRIYAAGGDGTAHEVANGILQAGIAAVELIVAPIGSANDYAFSLDQEYRADSGPSDPLLTVDVGRIRAADGRERFFIAALGLGFNGQVTVEAHQIGWLQGLPLYLLATLRALAKSSLSREMSVQINGGIPRVGQTMLLSVLIGKREGNFPLAPQARLADGWFDYVQASISSRWEVLRLLPRVAWSGPPQNHPRVMTGLCQTMRVNAAAALTVHADGEIFCTVEDDLRDFEIELLPQRLRVGLWPRCRAWANPVSE